MMMVSANRGGGIPMAALKAIVSTARSKGLPIIVRPEGMPGGSFIETPVVTRIGKPESTPLWGKTAQLRHPERVKVGE